MEGPIDIDLSALPAGDRFAFWHDCGSLIYRPTPLACYQKEGLEVRSRLLQLGEVVLGRMLASAQRYERTAPMVKRDQVDSLHLILVEEGEINWSFDRQSLHFGAGDLVLLDASQASTADWSRHQIIFANFPRELLAPLAKGQQHPTLGILRAEHPYCKVLTQHLQSLWRCQISGVGGTCKGLGMGLAVLVQSYFQDSLCLSAPSLSHQSQASHDLLLASIQQWIKARLHRNDLNAQMIGQVFYLSRSSIYELFKPLGGVRHYIQSLRLERAFAELRSERASRVSIGRLAAELGFSSVSSFSRTFRDRWGLSPKDVKAQAIEQLAGNGQKRSGAGSSIQDGAVRHRIEESCSRYYATFKRP